MVDFKKRLGQRIIEKLVDPRDIYNTLDRRSETGPLRPAQNMVLGEWFENRRYEKMLLLSYILVKARRLLGFLFCIPA